MNGLRRLRERAGMEQRQLAEHEWLGVHPVTVCLWECGKAFPRKRHLDALARIFRCTIADLLTQTEGSRTA